MTFWQENYGFVKEVYDFRLAKYQEWMDNLEGIVSKVLSQDVQYTYKEFKIIQDNLSVSMVGVFVSGTRQKFPLLRHAVLQRGSLSHEMSMLLTPVRSLFCLLYFLGLLTTVIGCQGEYIGSKVFQFPYSFSYLFP